ncbi:MAG: SRPBCC domain-containing protein [Actinomycetaceae bacterium]
MTIPPLRREVLVACDPATARRLWTEEIGLWWPLASFGCFGAGGTLAFDGPEIVETSTSGERAVWGTVIEDGELALTFSWHPGRDASEATHVRVSFTATGSDDVTLVTLIHTGWESTAARDEYAGGWVTVLGELARTRSVDTPNALWFVLEHIAGPAAPPEGVFSSDDFPLHLAFLRTVREQGALVAAGPLPDTPGAGLTVVRVPDLASAQRLLTAAQTEDGAVVSGLLDLRIRPWRVALTSID